MEPKVAAPDPPRELERCQGEEHAAGQNVQQGWEPLSANMSETPTT